MKVKCMHGVETEYPPLRLENGRHVPQPLRGGCPECEALGTRALERLQANGGVSTRRLRARQRRLERAGGGGAA